MKITLKCCVRQRERAHCCEFQSSITHSTTARANFPSMSVVEIVSGEKTLPPTRKAKQQFPEFIKSLDYISFMPSLTVNL
jgi:hypothetical protein